MKLYNKLKKHNINLSFIGLNENEIDETYFCTPKGAEILGFAGVDGIHYCTIRYIGDIIFSVNPMNLPNEYVHPIAQNFEDLIGLLISCGSLDAIEQTFMWNKEQFETYIRDNPPTEQFQETINLIKNKYDIKSIDNPFHYIKNLQSTFDYSLIKYTKDYYDIDMNPDASNIENVQNTEKKTEEWKVTFDGSFRYNKGRAAKEIKIEKHFKWNDENWYIPAIYTCSKGLIIDFLKSAEPSKLKEFIEKWDLLDEENKNFSKEERHKIEYEHPLNSDFSTNVILNNRKLHSKSGMSISWIPKSCLNNSINEEYDAKYVLEHYGLDLEMGWSIHRCSFKWDTKNKPKIKSLDVFMKNRLKTIYGEHFNISNFDNNFNVLNCDNNFNISNNNEIICFKHPLTNEDYKLQIHEYENNKLKNSNDEEVEFPTNFVVMGYTVSPEISENELNIVDYNDGDRPKYKNLNANAPIATASIGIIGGSRGATSIKLDDGNETNERYAFSSVYFDVPKNIDWHMVFNVKNGEDLNIKLI